ncbi:hypothetical protein FHX49_002391 [Microbacterium endophyticum]|uniref:Lipoprotein n=1 Tax=Microbacterium endophyticum TaxID=1526412 RepID=A0A7W4V5U6_9MICO|nr:hypothetical protein [Microbacterium endophyticum]MBB2976805.1 hypothetical protein [Microbacterium endophyticum]NIK36558.1 hypothetical protein [Microbacterium endophyticum]
MKISKFVVASVLVMASIGLSGCSSSSDEPGDVIAPVTMDAGELQGETVDLVVGQVLNINTGDLAVDSYTGEVADEKVAEFVAGYVQDGTTFNPGISALATGESSVTLTNSDGGIQPLEFTVVVSPRS